MSTITIDVATIVPMSHEEAMRLQAQELEHTVSALRSVGEGDWAAATDCPDWDVRAMYQHVLGACEAGASMRENMHQMWRARSWRRRHGGSLEAALSSVQVAERAGLSGPQVVARLAEVAPATVRSRTRMPSFVRNHVRLKIDGPVFETWTLGYLVDVIYLRDLWMHRVDLHRALGRPLALDSGHDGRIVADVVAEWARRHGKAFVLDLTGPAGGTYAGGAGGPDAASISIDAVDFGRTLAGRSPATDLLATVVPF